MRKLLLFLAFLFPLSCQAADLAQSTATQVSVYFQDPATYLGKTSLTVTSITCRYVKSDMTTASFSPTASGGTNDMVEMGNGYYRLEVTAAQLDTLGTFDLHCQISGFPSPPNVYAVLAGSSPTFSGSYMSIDSLLGTTVPASYTAGTVGSQIGKTLTKDTVLEGTMTVSHWFQYGGASLFGKYTQSPTGTFNFRDFLDSKNRLTYTTDATHRLTVTYNPD